MLGDEAQLEGESQRRARGGRRHAAPRKSMLTRLQMPAGKAVALAAMPTAVLMGMGLTPQLAQASQQSKGGYKPGPCVSKPDEADKDTDKAKDKDSAKPSESAKSTADKDKAEPKPSASQSADTKADETDKPEPSESSSTSKSGGGLLGGVGDTLNSVLGGGDSSSSDASADEPADEESAKPSASESDGLVGKVTDTANKTVKGVGDTAGKTVKGVGDTVGKATQGIAGATGGPEAFPCPEHDADALANAEYEDTPSRLPDQPWKMKASTLSLHGLDYHGIVKVRTHNGQLKKVLKFTAKGVDIKDLHQIVEGPGGTQMHVVAAKGSTSTIRQGTVTLYTEQLKGNLFGIVPITFSPMTPPPLNIKEVFFTNAEVTQAGQFGGALTVPGLSSYGTQG